MLGIGLRAHRDDPMPARAAVFGRPRRRRLRRPGVLSQVVSDAGAKVPGGERARPSGWSPRVRGLSVRGRGASSAMAFEGGMHDPAARWRPSTGGRVRAQPWPSLGIFL
jgi:hypothetical protein